MISSYSDFMFIFTVTTIAWLVATLVTLDVTSPRDYDSNREQQYKRFMRKMLVWVFSLTTLAVDCAFFIYLGPADIVLSYLRAHWIFSLLLGLGFIGIIMLCATNTVIDLVALVFALIFIQVAVNYDWVTISLAILCFIVILPPKVKTNNPKKDPIPSKIDS